MPITELDLEITTPGTLPTEVTLQIGPAGPTGPTGPQGPTGPAGTTDYTQLVNVPATFPPSTHTHVSGDITDATDDATAQPGKVLRSSGSGSLSLTALNATSLSAGSASISSLSLSTALSIANGGTGATTVDGARSALDVYSKAESDALSPSVDNASVNAAIAENPAATRESAEAAFVNPQANLDSYLWTKHSFRKVAGWNPGPGVGSPPLRIARMGDSLSAQGLQCSAQNMAISGYIGSLTPVSGGTGSYTYHTGVSPKHEWSISGNAYEFALSSTYDITLNGSATGDLRGDKCCIGYIKRPNGAQFALQYQVNATGSWTTLTTIDTESGDATTYGVHAEYSLPSSPVYYRLRVTSVTGDVGDTAVIAYWGIYHSNGGGVIEVSNLDRGGATPAQFNATNAAVFDPFWTGLSPDLVVSMWNDEASNWEDGGSWDLLYDRMVAQKAETDHIVCTAYPSNVPSEEAIYAPARVAQRQWAERNDQSYYDVWELFRGDWAAMDALGLMADGVHPSSVGREFAMQGLWNAAAIGRIPLGGLVRLRKDSFPYFQHAGYGNPNSNHLSSLLPLEIRNAAGLRMMNTPTTAFSSMWDIKPLSSGEIEVIQGNNVRAAWFRPGTYWRGVSPYSDGYNSAGSPLKRWRGVYTAALSTAVVTKTADYTVDADKSIGNRPYDHTILCNATSGAITITLPAASLSYESENPSAGRILVIKKIDSSGNAVTIDGNASETIDGATTLSLTAQWDTVTIQCDGSAWYVLSRS